MPHLVYTHCIRSEGDHHFCYENFPISRNPLKIIKKTIEYKDSSTSLLNRFIKTE